MMETSKVGRERQVPLDVRLTEAAPGERSYTVDAATGKVAGRGSPRPAPRCHAPPMPLAG
ncbi:hypothetical protein [Pseudofrankia sp. BMG5.37]|uniref:hypothetical protein n=1 Tax=Pseudofrankia sp. BMG5.37 TaxID=3050035 RepID=UPI0028940BFF|nr:hypothetical protein [Pseudofrankia sp. BMG5.37]MDT3440608.1 hypothetical protein [Pseudofrankia sp. BMG5.37]